MELTKDKTHTPASLKQQQHKDGNSVVIRSVVRKSPKLPNQHLSSSSTTTSSSTSTTTSTLSRKPKIRHPKIPKTFLQPIGSPSQQQQQQHIPKSALPESVQAQLSPEKVRELTQTRTELSQLLQLLSEKARSGTEFIQRLKCMGDQVHANSVDFEAHVVEHCDALVAAIRARQAQLVQRIQEEKQHKHTTFREQITHCTSRLHSTTALIQFSIEVLKESDPAAFLQVSSSLLNRVTNAERNFQKEMEFEARVSSEFELSLDHQSVTQAIQALNFLQMKDGIVAPGAPRIVPEDCSAENNTVTIAWAPHHSSHVDGYVLELDDGSEGDFREVYCGKEPICTVEGLHFDSMYNARVKAFNHAGDSQYSQTVCLQTAEVAWFTLDPSTASPDVIFTNDNLSASSHSFDDRTIIGTVGFSRGIHYWEYTIDRHDNNKDPAFGIARFDVSKDKMLGKDEKGWSMYVDNTRSWFMQDGAHSDRTEGGITQGSVVGVLLDLNQHHLSFYINGQPHGPIAFTGLKGTFYPAVTLNRNVQISLHTGLVPPADSDTEDE